jgi:outer membrane protein OmpA-like peptidoglycan-associated protein
MLKQDWCINESEKSRILNLHENATKKHYITEQDQSRKSWRLCGNTVFEKDGRYYTTDGEGTMLEIPKLSELEGVIQRGDLVLNQVTENGIKLGDDFNMTRMCSNKKPQMYAGMDSLFVYFDDLETQLPYFGILGWNGRVGTSKDDFMGEKIPKDKDGVVVKFKKSRSKSFILEISPAMKGSLDGGGTTEPTKEKPKPEIISLNLQSPFIFDDIKLTPEAENEFLNFMKNLKKNYQGMKGNVDIITTASIDGDPNTRLKNGMTRQQYDLELSRRRANEIVRRLENESGVTSLNFIAKGIGQTSQYGPSWPDAKSTSETAPNRRLIINLPTIERKL